MPQKISRMTKLLRRSHFDLPVGVYAVTPNGRFIDANSHVRSLLGLASKGSVNANISDFYARQEDRVALLQEVGRSGVHGAKRVVHFKVGNRDLYIQFYCREIRDPESHGLMGYFGCMVDVTEEEHYRNLFDNLPAGVYQLDADDHIVRANQAFAILHGYISADELLGSHVSRFYATPLAAEEVRLLILKQKVVANRKTELIRADGTRFYASLNATALFDLKGTYTGREGTLVDISREEKYRRILDDLPVGFYYVETKEGLDVIADCNKQFVDIHELDSISNAIGRNIRDFHFSRDDSRRFLGMVEDHAKRDEPILGFPFRIKTAKGKVKTLEINSRPSAVGRVGAVRDITQDEDLRRRVREFTSDFGGVLHIYTQTLMQLNHNLETMQSVLGPDPFSNKFPTSSDEIGKALEEPWRQLVGYLGAFLRELEERHSNNRLPDENVDRLKNLYALIRDYKELVPYEAYWGPTLTDAAVEVRSLSQKSPHVALPRSSVKQVAAAAQALAQIGCLLTLKQARETILAVDHQVSALREYVTSGARRIEQIENHRIIKLVRSAISNLVPFARYRNVDIELRNSAKNAEVIVAEREMTRAIGNIIHNAVKYSWHRGAIDERTWVSVIVSARDGKALITVENWGVPIPHDEIEKNLIFQLGFRGRLSSDRGRIGTGIGLTDAIQVAQEYGGSIRVTSRPSAPEGDPHNYEQPFITTVIINLPVAPQRKGESVEETDSLDRG